ncbi:hypothetical protein H4F63_01405 [Pectobacterium brasiliense]|nr:hypothetical protein [Pectobacterium brasiliense]MBN3126293.1 hypothetical protein [Pectobacterium brasiliense]
MYDAAIINFSGHQFLLPERGFFIFPAEFENQRGKIEKLSKAYDRLMESLANPFSTEAGAASEAIKLVRDDLADFIILTGVIGAPFDSKDARLYAADKRIRIISVFEF